MTQILTRVRKKKEKRRKKKEERRKKKEERRNRELTNCIFEERIGREMDYMHTNVRHYIVVVACSSLQVNGELLIHYSYRQPILARHRRLNLGQEANVHLGRPPRRL